MHQKGTVPKSGKLNVHRRRAGSQADVLRLRRQLAHQIVVGAKEGRVARQATARGLCYTRGRQVGIQAAQKGTHEVVVGAERRGAMQPVEGVDMDCPGARCSAAELRQVRVAHHCRVHHCISQRVRLGLPRFLAAQTAAALLWSVLHRDLVIAVGQNTSEETPAPRNTGGAARRCRTARTLPRPELLLK